MDSKKRNIIIAVAAAVIAVVIAVVTIVFITNKGGDGTEPYIGNDSSTRVPTVKYDPDDYTSDICANCETYIEGQAYEPTELLKSLVTADIELDEIAVCEECAKGMYEKELAEGRSLDEFIKK